MASGFAGIALNSGFASENGPWNPEQRLFVGLAGNGQWIVSPEIGQNLEVGFGLFGGDIYHVIIDFNPGTTGPLAGRYRVQIYNETRGTRSALFEGALGGEAGRSINAFGIANGVVGNEQNLIVDDIEVWAPATITLATANAIVQPGAHVVLDAQTSGLSGFLGASIQLGYEAQYVQSASAAAGTLLPSPQLFVQQQGVNQLDFSVSSSQATNITTDGLWATVSATLAEGIAPGTTFLPFMVRGFEAVNAAGRRMAVVPVVAPLTTSSPAISLDPVSLAFGDVTLGQSPSRTITLSNPGSAPLILSSATVSVPAFAVSPETLRIGPDSSKVLTITFTPTREEAYADTLVLATNIVGQESVRIPLSGAGQLFRVTVWPGDTDNDGEVTAADLIPIGTYYGVTGPARPGGMVWQGRTLIPWETEAATFADVNGDGVVNVMDVLGIGVNFGRSRTSGLGKALLAEPISTLQIRSLPVGTRFTVTLDRNEAQALMGVAAMLEADASLRPVSATGATLMSEQGLEFTLAQGGTLHAAYTRVRGEAPLQTSGAVMEATFEVIAPIASSAEVRLMRVSTSDPAGASVPGTFTLNSQVALNTEFGVGLPSELTLDGNAPNPAVSRTLLRIGVPETSATRLTVYDTLGREVHRETLGTLSAGWHLLPLDVSRLAPGLYVWRVEAGSHSQSRSLTVVR